VARVKAILRRGRCGTGELDAPLAFAHISLDPQRFEVTRAARPSTDRPGIQAAAHLASYAGWVLSREHFWSGCWATIFTATRAWGTFISATSGKKLEVDPANPVFVLTVRGVGYKFQDDPA
jgi:two-component system response regulator RegX3